MRNTALPRPARRASSRLHHRHERRDAGPGRDEQVRPIVVGLEHELALRSDHPHPVADRQPPEQRRERAALDQPDVELVAARRRRRAAARRPSTGRCTSLPSAKTPIVMYWPGSNGVGLAVEPDPERREARRCMSSRAISVALYCGALGSMTRSSTGRIVSVMGAGASIGSLRGWYPAGGGGTEASRSPGHVAPRAS